MAPEGKARGEIVDARAPMSTRSARCSTSCLAGKVAARRRERRRAMLDRVIAGPPPPVCVWVAPKRAEASSPTSSRRRWRARPEGRYANATLASPRICAGFQTRQARPAHTRYTPWQLVPQESSRQHRGVGRGSRSRVRFALGGRWRGVVPQGWWPNAISRAAERSRAGSSRARPPRTASASSCCCRPEDVAAEGSDRGRSRGSRRNPVDRAEPRGGPST